jgi:predicted N-acyltransferase
MDDNTFEIRIEEGLENISPEQWNLLGGNDNPFLSYAFLHGMEIHACVGEEFGWYPRHITLWEQDRLIAACPIYIKTNSYGEFVFDWSWASAYERSGGHYYPKLVCGIPYTPSTGRRLLVHPDHPEPKRLKQHMIDTAIEMARSAGYSGMHWLFTDEEDTALLRENGLIMRMGCQYHWNNNQYRDFDDFLSRMSSKKRKNIRRERRLVAEQNLQLEVIKGPDISDELWETFYGFYVDTFDKKSGIPTLTLPFFRDMSRQLGENVLLVMASDEDGYVAGAINFVGKDSLYGRYWGTRRDDYDCLHFETCFYRGIEHAIANGLHSYEPGAQGEHKIPRGFLPTPTWSAHWLNDPGFREVIARYCNQEITLMKGQCEELYALSPFREGEQPPGQGPLENS